MTCAITNKSTMRGRNVSHANNKTGRNFRVNTHWHWFEVPWGRERLKVCRRGMAQIYKNGGLVQTLLQTHARNLGIDGAALKKRLESSLSYTNHKDLSIESASLKKKAESSTNL